MYNLDSIVVSFFIYSVLGWVCEVLYCSIPRKRFVNRGFLFGPWLPIYGFGAMVAVLALEPLKDRWWLVFLVGMVLTSILEYITSWGLEKLFKVKLWDYSTYPLNINGRVCALNSTLFGLLCLLIVYVINVPVYSWICSLSPLGLNLWSFAVTAVMSSDTATSVVKMTAFRKAVEELNKAKAEAEARFKELKEVFSPEKLSEAKAKFRADLESKAGKSYGNIRRVLRANPGLTAKGDLKEQIALARESVEVWKTRRRQEKAERKLARKLEKKNRKEKA